MFQFFIYLKNIENKYNNNGKKNNEKDIDIFATFIGGKIKILKGKGIRK